MMLIQLIVVSTLYFTPIWCEIMTQGKTFVQMAGDGVTLPCMLSTKDDKSTVQIKWYKYQESESVDKIAIANNEDMQGVFKNNPARFPAITLKNANGGFDYNAMIKNLKPEDSGTYVCEMSSDKPTAGVLTATHKVWVAEPIKEVAMYGYPDKDDVKTEQEQLKIQNDTMEYEDGKDGVVVCKSSGGLPPPKHHVYIVNKDMTKQKLAQKKTAVPTWQGNDLGMKKPVAIDVVTKYNWLFSKADEGKSFMCIAEVEGKKEYEMKVSKMIDIANYDPPVGKATIMTSSFFALIAPLLIVYKLI